MEDFEIRKTEKRGWGIFALRDFAMDELVERAPVVIMTGEEMVLLNQTKLHDYIFHWEDGKCCMALGNVPIFNHQAPSNCEYFQDYEQAVIEIKTVRAIRTGEEMTINYMGDAENKEAVWFRTS